MTQNQVKDISDYAQNYKNVGVDRDDGNSKGEYMSIFCNTDIIDMIEWGTSPEKIALKAGKHKFVLKCESDADNMSRKVNDFMLKGCRLTLDSAK